jgi:hypothetical protein
MPDYPHSERGTVQDKLEQRLVPSTLPRTHRRDAKMSPENNLQLGLFRNLTLLLNTGPNLSAGTVSSFSSRDLLSVR